MVTTGRCQEIMYDISNRVVSFQMTSSDLEGHFIFVKLLL